MLLQQGVRLIVRLNRRKSRKGTPTALVPAPFAPRARMIEEEGRGRWTGERERDAGRRGAARRFQSDTNLYGGEILAILAESSNPFALARSLQRSLLSPASSSSFVRPSSLFRASILRVNWNARV